MRDMPVMDRVARLSRTERLIAGLVGAGLLCAALTLIVAPPEHRVALAQCPEAAAGCIVSVDSDLTTFAAVLAAGAAAAMILALLGVRFNQVKVAGAEFGYGYEKEIVGLTRAVPVPGGTKVTATSQPSLDDMPIRVATLEEPEKSPYAVPVPVTQLTTPMRLVDPAFLHEYILGRTASQHSYFLTHILGPATQSGQKYAVAIRVTPHEGATQQVRAATFYLGRAWGDRAFEGSRGSDGRFGIATEAFGPFLALCEVEFDDGSRILLDRYCDFDIGALLPP